MWVFYGNFLPRKTAVLSELKFMKTKVPILGIHIDLITDNVLNGRNNHLEPSRKN